MRGAVRGAAGMTTPRRAPSVPTGEMGFSSWTHSASPKSPSMMPRLGDTNRFSSCARGAGAPWVAVARAGPRALDTHARKPVARRCGPPTLMSRWMMPAACRFASAMSTGTTTCGQRSAREPGPRASALAPHTPQPANSAAQGGDARQQPAPRRAAPRARRASPPSRAPRAAAAPAGRRSRRAPSRCRSACCPGRRRCSGSSAARCTRSAAGAGAGGGVTFAGRHRITARPPPPPPPQQQHQQRRRPRPAPPHARAGAAAPAHRASVRKRMMRASRRMERFLIALMRLLSYTLSTTPPPPSFAHVAAYTTLSLGGRGARACARARARAGAREKPRAHSCGGARRAATDEAALAASPDGRLCAVRRAAARARPPPARPRSPRPAARLRRRAPLAALPNLLEAREVVHRQQERAAAGRAWLRRRCRRRRRPARRRLPLAGGRHARLRLRRFAPYPGSAPGAARAGRA